MKRLFCVPPMRSKMSQAKVKQAVACTHSEPKDGLNGPPILRLASHTLQSKRTAGAKALISPRWYGTAKAVP